jgi:hypothetical protein
MPQFVKTNTMDLVPDMPEESSRVEEKGRMLVSRENRSTVGDITVDRPRMICRKVNVHYGDKHAIKDVSIDIGNNERVGHDRSFRVRQVHLYPLPQPYERYHRHLPGDR